MFAKSKNGTIYIAMVKKQAMELRASLAEVREPSDAIVAMYDTLDEILEEE